MNNYNGTLFRIVFIFVFLLSILFFISFSIFLLVTFLFNIDSSFSMLAYILSVVLLIRVFYPKFIFKN